jgi:DNA gyrase/topoisomerase IV subunit B
MSKEDFKILSARDHVRMRTGMYLGSTALEQQGRFVLGIWREVSFVPALLKMVDEILDNSIDEAIRTEFKHANEISVNVQKKQIIIRDNGRGIPLDEITDTETGEKMLRPAAAWTRVRAGTSFDDDRVTIGANGVGSACVNFMSVEFIGETWSNGRSVRVSCTQGANFIQVEEAERVNHDQSGTQVSFRPDFSLLNVDSFEDGDHIELIHDRLNSLQIAFPEIKFKINGKLVKATNMRQYAALFAGEGSAITQQRENLALIIASSSDGFRQTGYINGVNTRLGGSYNDYVINGITDEMQKMIKRKYKVEVNRSTIKSGLVFVLFARNFTDPQYDAQTKERLTSSQSAVKAHYDSSESLNFEQLAKKVMACDDIIEPIVEAQVAKKAAADKRAATLAQKKLKRVKVQKHVAASGKDATLFLCEGDSAMGFLLKVRDPKTVGGFPLRGVVMNTFDKKPADVLKNKELSELIAVLGLDINDPDSVDNMDYARIATLADADHDGNHISGLLLAFFYKYWPRLFTEGRVVITRTPIMISTKGGKTEWFYSYDAARDFKSKNTGWYHRYIKGLASLTEAEYDVIINQPRFDLIEIDNAKWFDVMFGKDSEPRKQWLKMETPELVK